MGRAMKGFRTIEAAPPRGGGMAKSWRHVRVLPLVLVVLLSVLGPLTLASDSPPARNTSPPGGEAMPVGNLPGWKQVFSEDFVSGDVPVGGFPGDVYGPKWSEKR